MSSFELVTREFERIFASWRLRFPEQHLQDRTPGTVSEQGWIISFVFGEKDGKGYLEFYAQHRMTSDRHVRIYDDGSVENLDAIETFYSYDPDTPEDEERAERAYIEHNRRVAEELERTGLWRGTINEVLRAGMDNGGDG